MGEAARDWAFSCKHCSQPFVDAGSAAEHEQSCESNAEYRLQDLSDRLSDSTTIDIGDAPQEQETPKEKPSSRYDIDDEQTPSTAAGIFSAEDYEKYINPDGEVNIDKLMLEDPRKVIKFETHAAVKRAEKSEVADEEQPAPKQGTGVAATEKAAVKPETATATTEQPVDDKTREFAKESGDDELLSAINQKTEQITRLREQLATAPDDVKGKLQKELTLHEQTYSVMQVEFLERQVDEGTFDAIRSHADQLESDTKDIAKEPKTEAPEEATQERRRGFFKKGASIVAGTAKVLTSVAASVGGVKFFYLLGKHYREEKKYGAIREQLHELIVDDVEKEIETALVVTTTDEEGNRVEAETGGTNVLLKMTELREAVQNSDLPLEKRHKLIRRMYEIVGDQVDHQIELNRKQSEEMREVLNTTLRSSVKRLELVKEGVNTALVAASGGAAIPFVAFHAVLPGALAFRAAMYGGVSLGEHIKNARAEARKQEQDYKLIQDLATAARDTFTNAFGKAKGETGKARALNRVAAYATLARTFVIGGLGISQFEEGSEQAQKMIEKLLDAATQNVEAAELPTEGIDAGLDTAGSEDASAELEKAATHAGHSHTEMADKGLGSAAGEEAAADTSGAAASIEGDAPSTPAAKAGIETAVAGTPEITPEQVQNAIINKGEGIEHALQRQLEASPDTFGYDSESGKSIADWADSEAHRIAIENDFVDHDTGMETRVFYNPDNPTSFILNEDGSVDAIDAQTYQQAIGLDESFKAELAGQPTEPNVYDIKAVKVEIPYLFNSDAIQKASDQFTHFENITVGDIANYVVGGTTFPEDSGADKLQTLLKEVAGKHYDQLDPNMTVGQFFERVQDGQALPSEVFEPAATGTASAAPEADLGTGSEAQPIDDDASSGMSESRLEDAAADTQLNESESTRVEALASEHTMLNDLKTSSQFERLSEGLKQGLFNDEFPNAEDRVLLERYADQQAESLSTSAETPVGDAGATTIDMSASRESLVSSLEQLPSDRFSGSEISALRNLLTEKPEINDTIRQIDQQGRLGEFAQSIRDGRFDSAIPDDQQRNLFEKYVSELAKG